MQDVLENLKGLIAAEVPETAMVGAGGDSMRALEDRRPHVSADG